MFAGSILFNSPTAAALSEQVCCGHCFAWKLCVHFTRARLNCNSTALATGCFGEQRRTSSRDYGLISSFRPTATCRNVNSTLHEWTVIQMRNAGTLRSCSLSQFDDQLTPVIHSPQLLDDVAGSRTVVRIDQYER